MATPTAELELAAVMTIAIAFPNIDPVLFELGPVVVRWYSLAFIAGLLIGWRYLRRQAVTSPNTVDEHDVDDFLVWATIGVVFGGRLGYVLFYKPGFYFGNPSEILAVWRGGMSFHGGFLGVVIAGLIFVRMRNIPALNFADLLSCVAPIGLFFGRLANFVNGELFGRITDVPWAMVFPRGGPEPRHPSQLYEAVLEGLVLFVLLYLLSRQEPLRRRPGLLTGVFLSGYGGFRIVGETFRQPDLHLGLLTFGLTMGQWLSLPMLGAGFYLIARARSKD
mgnify:FL=1